MRMKPEDEWTEDDATWRLLGKAAPVEARGRFADDTLRLVRQLPGSDPWRSRVVGIAPWAAVAACGVLGAVFLMDPVGTERGTVVETRVQSDSENWGEIEDVADTEILVAAMDHLDEFSDQELVSLVGF